MSISVHHRTPSRLREQVLQKNAAAWDVKPATHSNILTRLDKHGQMSLAALIRFLTLKDIQPVDVSDPHLEEFEIWLTDRTLIAEPRNVLTAARRAWNKAVLEVAAWPKTPFTQKSLRSQLLLPFSEFPSSFRDEVADYAKRIADEDDDANFGIEPAEPAEEKNSVIPAFKKLRPLTIDSKLQRIKAAANALHRSGVAVHDTGT